MATITKIIRDGLEERIRKSEKKLKIPKGERTRFKRLKKDDQLLLVLLAKKLIEETKEFLDSLESDDIHSARKEYADILDVVDKVSSIHDFEIRHISALRINKRFNNGGFVNSVVATFHPKTLKLHQRLTKEEQKRKR